MRNNTSRRQRRIRAVGGFGATLALAGLAAASMAPASSATVTGGPGAVASSTSVVCYPAKVRVGQMTNCSATVTGGIHPTGTVTLNPSGNGSTAGPCTLVPIGGNQARCTVSFGPTDTNRGGGESIGAAYSGDQVTSLPSNGETGINVTPGLSSTSVSCAPGTVAVGTATTCTVTINGPFEPTGGATFFSNESGTFSPTSSCISLTIGSGSISCSVMYTPRAVESGTHKIYARYPGDANGLPSHGSTTITVTP